MNQNLIRANELIARAMQARRDHAADVDVMRVWSAFRVLRVKPALRALYDLDQLYRRAFELRFAPRQR